MTLSGTPNLATFDRPASWLNRAGRIDRSACVELKASDLWRAIPHDGWRERLRQDPVGRKDNRPFLLAEAQTEANAYLLADLHDRKVPFSLKGDFRTSKANALKPTSPKPQPSSIQLNPNRGQSRTKMLGLPTDWSQPLTIQRWRLHARLAQHFFACPRCDQRALKLFLPLCSKEELRDAITAQLWLDSNPKRIATSPTLRPQASSLVARYAPIFPPRQLQCRKCLALRYGDVRPSSK